MTALNKDQVNELTTELECSLLKGEIERLRAENGRLRKAAARAKWLLAFEDHELAARIVVEIAAALAPSPDEGGLA